MVTLLVWWCLVMLRAERWVFFCYGIMVLHEFAHVMAAVILHCPVEKIVIYPFGLCAEIKMTERLSFSRRLFLYGAGACAHLVVYGVLYLLRSYQLISVLMFEYMIQMNMNYLLFNLLPVYPLDGYQILLSFLYLVLPYRYALYISELISILMVYLFLAISPQTAVILMSGLILLGINVLRCLKLKQEMHCFYLKRYLFPVEAPCKIHQLEDCFVYCRNIIAKENEIVSEKTLLKKILKL